MTGSLPAHLAKYVPPGARVEVKLAYNVATREGRIIGEGVGREYGEPGPFDVFGGADVIGIDDGRVIVVDWKTGFSTVEPAMTNPQLACYALAACRALAKDSAIVRVVYTRTGICDEAVLDALDLAAFGDRLEQLFQVSAKRGEVSTREGSWCKHCASKHVCPSKHALLVQIGTKGLAAVGDTTMTADRAADAYRQLVAIRQLVDDAERRLHAYVDEHGPIDLGDGRMYGRYIRPGRERLDADVTASVIADVVGESAREFASIAIERSTSKAAIERAAKAVQPEGYTRLVKAVVARVRELGGSRRSEERPIGEYLAGKYRAALPLDVDADDLERRSLDVD